MPIIFKILASLSILGLNSGLSLPEYIKDRTDLIFDQSQKAEIIENAVRPVFVQPLAVETPKVAEVRYVTVTAYSSTEDQTDSTPFIAASGKRVYDGMAACNFLRFGAKVRFPELSEAKVYEIGDRMALKHSDKIDIWFETREEAKQFGKRTLKVEILDI